VAHETLKMLILSKLPKRQACPPQVLALLAQLNGTAKSFHATVTIVYRQLPPDKRKELMRDPRLANADKAVRETLDKLKESGVNLYGFDSMDFCEAFAEVYKAYAAAR